MNEMESKTEYWTEFNEKVMEIQGLLESSSITTENIQEIKNKISVLQVYSTRNIELLPKYDVRRSQEEIELLKKKTQTVEEKFQPRKKFTFSSKSKAKQDKSVTSPSNSSDNSTTATPTITNPSTADESILKVDGCVTIENKSKETLNVKDIILATNSNHDHIQLLIRNCQNCRIYLTTALGSARFESLSNCQIFLGPCATSVYLESCTNSLFFLWCHQLRIHTTTSSDLYVFVNSHPIIEDCSLLRFSPYLLDYNSLQEDVLKTHLETSRNWNNVVDFRWHRSTPSPNWTILPPMERISLIDIEGLRISTIPEEGGGGGDGISLPPPPPVEEGN